MSTSQTIPIGGNVDDQSIGGKDQDSQHSEPDHLQSDPCVVESTRRSCNVTYTYFPFCFNLLVVILGSMWCYCWLFLCYGELPKMFFA